MGKRIKKVAKAVTKPISSVTKAPGSLLGGLVKRLRGQPKPQVEADPGQASQSLGPALGFGRGNRGMMPGDPGRMRPMPFNRPMPARRPSMFRDFGRDLAFRRDTAFNGNSATRESLANSQLPALGAVPQAPALGAVPQPSPSSPGLETNIISPAQQFQQQQQQMYQTSPTPSEAELEAERLRKEEEERKRLAQLAGSQEV